MRISSARRRYAWRIACAMLVFLVTFAVADYWIDERRVGGTVTAILACLSGLSVAAVFWALGRLLVEEQDEYRRMLLVREILIGTGITMTVATTWGLLAEYRVVEPGHAFYLVWLFFFAQGIGGIVNKLTLGDSVAC